MTHRVGLELKYTNDLAEGSAAKDFEKIKKAYVRKTANRTLTIQEEIAYLNAEQFENARLARLEIDQQLRAMGNDTIDIALSAVNSGATSITRHVKKVEAKITDLEDENEALKTGNAYLSSKPLDTTMEMDRLSNELRLARAACVEAESQAEIDV